MALCGVYWPAKSLIQVNNKHRDLAFPLAQVFRRLTDNGEFAAIVEATRDAQ
ncbi:MAG: hypothetical protein ABNH34_02910 [Marinobacter sp.]|jgi:hypothetical protein|uniref:hypothetical protein n=1 Tax=Marinobacter sp. TaxID=50741 RepID=UPI0032D8B678